MEKKFLSNEYFSCFYSPIDFEINPYLEIKRAEFLLKILNKFIQTLTHKLGVEIFSIKKNYLRTLTNMFSSWLFVQYSREDCIKDPILPSGNISDETLKITIMDMMKYDFSIQKEDRETMASEILTLLNIKNECQNHLNEFKIYRKSDYYQNIKKKFNVYKFIKIKKIKNTGTEYYYMKIQLYEKIVDENILKVLRNIKISKSVYNKLKDKYKKHNKNFSNIDLDILIWCMMFRYTILGSHNHQLAVIPNVMEQLKNKLKLNIESFASGINHYFDNYCSLFYDLEKYFGSLGSFFNIEPIEGLFGFNPPYENYIMEKGTAKILYYLEKSEIDKKPLGFLITIPIWDKEGKIIMEEIYKSKPGKNMTIEYGEFKTISMINQSKFLKFKKLIPKNDFSYLDYFNMIYKDKTIQNTYIILMANKYMSIDTSFLNSLSFKHK